MRVSSVWSRTSTLTFPPAAGALYSTVARWPWPAAFASTQSDSGVVVPSEPTATTRTWCAPSATPPRTSAVTADFPWEEAAGRAVTLIGVYLLSCLAGSMPKADIFSDASFQADEPGSAAT